MHNRETKLGCNIQDEGEQASNTYTWGSLHVAYMQNMRVKQFTVKQKDDWKLGKAFPRCKLHSSWTHSIPTIEESSYSKAQYWKYLQIVVHYSQKLYCSGNA